MGAVALLAACASPPSGPPPIVLVSIDTFRADRLDPAITPNLAALAAESVVFEQAYSQAVQTIPSHTSLFTSRYPSEQVGADRQPFVPPDMPVLAEVLGAYGYDTAAFVGGADLRRVRGLAKGFDVYESARDFGSLWHTGPMALAWLDAREGDAPYLLFVHGYDTHSPYVKPPPFGFAHADARAEGPGMLAVRTDPGRIVDGTLYADFSVLVASYETELRPRSPEARARTVEAIAAYDDLAVPVEDADVALIRGVYDGAASYADTQLGLLLAGLGERGVLDEAVLVVLSDHGEQLGEHGLFGHCCETNDEEAHVPLLVRLPGGEGGGRRVTGFVELVDVMPTLLEVAGAEPPARAQGRSLVPALRGEPFAGREHAFTEGTEMMRTVSLRGPKGRLTWVGMPATMRILPAVLDAAWLGGPGFVASEGLAEVDRAAMRDALTARIRALTPSPAQGSHGPLPDDLKESLREHGYWNVP
ncbi:MAG: sulfatase [Myxococcota bacterium]